MQQPQHDLDDRYSLQSLDGIYVEVDALPSIASRQGLSAEKLQQDAETQLRQGGVDVLPMGVFRTGDPHLQIVVGVSDVRAGVIATHVQLNFLQIVFMRRNPLVTFNRARTWSATNATTIGPVAQLADVVRRECTRQLEQFIAAYRLGNP